MVLCLAAIAALVYIVTAKRFEDRVVGTNLVCTIVINIIAVLALYINEGFVVDICLVFAVLGFLAVVVLCRLLALQNLERKRKEAHQKEEKK
jgi:multicomponent Na+:H+ antiporter subunit F